MDSTIDLLAFAKGTSIILVGSVVSKFIVLLERIILGNQFSVEAFGELTLGVSLLSFAVFFTTSGLTQGVPRFLPREDTEVKKGTIINTGLVTVFFVSLVASAVMIAVDDQLFAYLFEGRVSNTDLAVYLLCIPFLSVFKTAISVVRGLEFSIYKVALMDLLYPILRVVLILVLVLGGLGTTSVPVAYFTALIVVTVASLVLIRHLVKFRLWPGFSTLSFDMELIQFSLPLMFSTVTAALLTKADTFMIAFLTNSYELGLYTAGYPLAASLPIFLGAFGFLYLPLVSRKLDSGESDHVSKMYHLTSKWSFLLTLPIFALILSFPSDILTVIYGPNFQPGGTALAVLSTGFIIHVAAGRNRETITASGYPRYVLLLNLSVLTANVVLNLVLIPLLGHLGAAIASAVSFLGISIVAYNLLRHLNLIDPVPRRNLRAFVVLPLLVIAPVMAVSGVIKLSAWLLLPTVVCLYGLTLLLSILTGVFQPEDLVLVKTIENRAGIEFTRLRRLVGAFL